MGFKIPTFRQVMGGGKAVKPVKAGHLAVAQGRQGVASSMAYRAYLKQTQAQREVSFKQAEQIAQRTNRAAKVANQQAPLTPPQAQAMSYGGKSFSSTLAPRPPANVKHPNYPTFPKPPKYGDEPVGRLEQTAPVYFHGMNESASGSTDKTYYNMWKSETAAKDRWRDSVKAGEKAYGERVEQFNKRLTSFQKGLNAFNTEMTERAKAAMRPPIELISTNESPDPKSGQRTRRGVGRGSLLTGSTGGFNPATGGNRLGGAQRSLLG
jgi:hypothetical protein